jgi:hypothetical protein
MSETGDAVKNWLAEHPKMTGVLFTMLLALQTAGTVAASNCSGSAGP